MQRMSPLYQFLPIGCVAAVIASVFSLTQNQSLTALPVFLVELSIVFAATFFVIGRIQKFTAASSPLRDSDPTVGIQRITEIVKKFGYKPQPQKRPGVWEFRVPIPMARFTWRNIIVEWTGAAAVRTVASRVVLTQIADAFPGTTELPYDGPQPLLTRGGGLLIPGAIIVCGFLGSILLYSTIRSI